MAANENLSWRWVERMILIGGIVVSVTLFVAKGNAPASVPELSAHEQKDAEIRKAQDAVDKRQDDRLGRLESLVESQAKQQQELLVTMTRVADRLDMYLASKQGAHQ